MDNHVTKQVRKRRELQYRYCIAKEVFMAAPKREPSASGRTHCIKFQNQRYHVCEIFEHPPIDRNDDEALAEQLPPTAGRPTCANDHRAKPKHGCTPTRSQRSLARAQPGSVAVEEADEECPARPSLLSSESED